MPTQADPTGPNSETGPRRISTRTKVAVGALATLLVASPFVPRGTDGSRDAAQPSGATEQAPQASLSTGESAVTTTAQAEIDRVVNAGLARSGRISARSTPDALANELVRCATFEGQQYCLGAGWTTESPTEVVAKTAVAAREATLNARAATTTNTGDLDAAALLDARASMEPNARALSERDELTQAAKAVAKVWLIRHEIQNVPLPDGFFDRHPEVQQFANGTGANAKSTAPSGEPTLYMMPPGPPTKTAADYPQRAVVGNYKMVSEQTRTYWCGPATMQMIAWNWSRTPVSQDVWADRLGTTSAGSSIWDMVDVTNKYTGWDSASYAGPYIVLDIADLSYMKWWKLIMRHIVDLRSPLIFHPILSKAYYPYLDDDASGHFQMGRGYDKKFGKGRLVSYFEPWNQQRFDPSEPYIDRVQWRMAYRSYRANKAHFQHNIGL